MKSLWEAGRGRGWAEPQGGGCTGGWTKSLTQEPRGGGERARNGGRGWGGGGGDWRPPGRQRRTAARGRRNERRGVAAPTPREGRTRRPPRRLRAMPLRPPPQPPLRRGAAPGMTAAVPTVATASTSPVEAGAAGEGVGVVAAGSDEHLRSPHPISPLHTPTVLGSRAFGCRARRRQIVRDRRSRPRRRRDGFPRGRSPATSCAAAAPHAQRARACCPCEELDQAQLDQELHLKWRIGCIANIG